MPSAALSVQLAEASRELQEVLAKALLPAWCVKRSSLQGLLACSGPSPQHCSFHLASAGLSPLPIVSYWCIYWGPDSDLFCPPSKLKLPAIENSSCMHVQGSGSLWDLTQDQSPTRNQPDLSPAAGSLLGRVSSGKVQVHRAICGVLFGDFPQDKWVSLDPANSAKRQCGIVARTKALCHTACGCVMLVRPKLLVPWFLHLWSRRWS